MTLVVLIRGDRKARVLNPMIIFTNASGSYPIRGVPDSVRGVTYRSAPNGFINKELMREWLKEARTWGPSIVRATRHLWLDNCGAHNDCGSIAKYFNTKIHYLPFNATDLCQPADSFVFSKLKDFWRKKWEM